jgi:membrane protein DedA with SNARE-associated domain
VTMSAPPSSFFAESERSPTLEPSEERRLEPLLEDNSDASSENRMIGRYRLLNRVVSFHGLFVPLSVAVLLGGVLLLFDPGEDLLLDRAISAGSAYALTSVFRDLVPAITSTLAAWGYSGVFLLMLVESISVPIPSEVILPYAGYLVFIGRLDFWVVVSLSTAAGTLGALVDYYLGLKISRTRAMGSIRGIAFIDERFLRVVDRWFRLHASSTVFLTRMVPGARTLASFPAGATRMPIRKFVAFTASGCLIWSMSLTYVGVYLGRNWEAVMQFSGYLSIVTVGSAGIALVGWFLVRRRRRR